MLGLISYIAELIMTMVSLGGDPQVLAEQGPYIYIRMADSCYVEGYNYGDSAVVVETVCAPLCASYVRVYNTEGIPLRDIPYPPDGMLHAAHIDSIGAVHWTNTTSSLLDESEWR